MNTTTRRSALTTIAAFAGAPTMVTMAAAKAVAHPDAELLALGQQLREMIPHYGVARDKYHELHDQAWS
jgi:hypothetical protein